MFTKKEQYESQTSSVTFQHQYFSTKQGQQAVETAVEADDFYVQLSASILVGTSQTALAAAALNVHHEDTKDQHSPRTDHDGSVSSAPNSSSTNRDSSAPGRVESSALSSISDESLSGDVDRLASLMKVLSSRHSGDQSQDGDSNLGSQRENKLTGNLPELARLLGSAPSSPLASPRTTQKDLSAELILALHGKDDARIDTIISDHDALIETPDNFGYTAFLYACNYCETHDNPDRVLKFLERKDINVNWKAASNGLTPLLALGI